MQAATRAAARAAVIPAGEKRPAGTRNGQKMSKLCDMDLYRNRIQTLGLATAAIIPVGIGGMLNPLPLLCAAPVLIAMIALHLAYHPLPHGHRRGAMISGLMLSDTALLLLGLHAALTGSVSLAVPIAAGTLLMHALLLRTFTPATQRAG